MPVVGFSMLVYGAVGALALLHRGWARARRRLVRGGGPALAQRGRAAACGAAASL
ncbi:hypothetical protein [Streptomyces sp. ODS28]|uniref:hypothetical protein n=1 Tax=Streptomyces sp. ODS28 TaxID=3136688 RepID=UPI0031ED323E